jgi:hypothetical protein
MSPDSRPPSRYVPGRPTPMPPVPNQEDDGPALMQDLEDDDDESLILPTTFKTPVTRIGKGSYKGEPDEATSGATKPGGKSSAGKKKKK